MPREGESERGWEERREDVRGTGGEEGRRG